MWVLQVEVAVLEDLDLLFGLAVESAEIEDRLFGSTSPNCKYVARSHLVNPGLSQAEILRLTHADSLEEAAFTSEPLSSLLRKKSGTGGLPYATPRRTSSLEQHPVTRGSGKGWDSPVSSSLRGSWGWLESHPLESIDSRTEYYDANEEHEVSSLQDEFEGVGHEPPGFERIPGMLPGSGGGVEEEEEEDFKNFISGQFVKRYQDSPDYDGVDMQVRWTPGIGPRGRCCLGPGVATLCPPSFSSAWPPSPFTATAPL